MLTRFFGFLSLPILSLIIPFLLNRNKKKSRVLMPAGIGISIVLVILGIVAIFSGGLSFIGFLKLSLFLVCYALMLVSVFFLITSFGFSGNLTQVIVTIIAFLMIGTVFYANPFIESASSQVRPAIIQWTINLNPIVIIAANFFSYDPMLSPVMYKLSLIQYYPHYYPSWGYVVLGYLIVSAICLLIFVILSKYKYKDDKLSPGD